MNIKSNQPFMPIKNFKGRMNVHDTIKDNFSAIDNQKIKKQIESTNNSRMQGDAGGASDMAKKLRLKNSALNKKPIKPLIRKRTAREYA